MWSKVRGPRARSDRIMESSFFVFVHYSILLNSSSSTPQPPCPQHQNTARPSAMVRLALIRTFHPPLPNSRPFSKTHWTPTWPASTQWQECAAASVPFFGVQPIWFSRSNRSAARVQLGNGAICFPGCPISQHSHTAPARVLVRTPSTIELYSQAELPDAQPAPFALSDHCPQPRRYISSASVRPRS